MKAWLQFFRLPNLPTAPGDALAGGAFAGAFAMAFDPVVVLAASGAELFLYMFGLADNDIAGIADDSRFAPDRPLPSGGISMRAAHVARICCLLLAVALGLFMRLPLAWWIAAGALVVCVFAYNRMKSSWLMGLCRATAFVSGACAVALPTVPVFAAASGWMLYIAAVTLLSKGEERDSEGLGNRRYIVGLAAFVPLAAFLFGARTLFLLPAIGCAWTYAKWCAAVAPLWQAHGGEVRRQAVGRTIGALLCMQTGFALSPREPMLMAAVVALWMGSFAIRRFAPSIKGS